MHFLNAKKVTLTFPYFYDVASYFFDDIVNVCIASYTVQLDYRGLFSLGLYFVLKR